MFKSVGVFFGFYVISLSCMAGPLPLNCQTSTVLEENFSELEEVAAKVKDCPRPTDGKFVNICTLVENQDLAYKKEFLAMSCADPKKDSPETVKSKVSLMWETYYKEFGCDSTGVPVGQGNVLKFSVNQEFELFVDGVVKDFGININQSIQDYKVLSEDGDEFGTGANFKYNLTRAVSMDVGYSHRERRFSADGDRAGFESDDAKIALNYAITRGLQLELYANQEKRTSVMGVQNYQENIVGINLSYHFK